MTFRNSQSESDRTISRQIPNAQVEVLRVLQQLDSPESIRALSQLTRKLRIPGDAH